MWGGWGIYSPNHQKWSLEVCCRMTHRTVRCATGHCPVRQPRQRTVGVRPLELWLVGPLGCPVVHQTGPVDCPVRQLRVLCTRRRAFNALQSTVAREGVVAPLAHRTVRWIIAERPLIFPKVKSSASSALVHRPRPGCLSGCLLLFCLNPFLGLFIGLLWTFGTYRIYRLEQTS
jgi:hypothetical protein